MRRKLQRWRALAAIATGMITLAGMAVLAAAPAQASTGGHPATNPKTSAAHYTNAPCNTVRLKAGHARCLAIVHTGLQPQDRGHPRPAARGGAGTAGHPERLQAAGHRSGPDRRDRRRVRRLERRGRPGDVPLVLRAAAVHHRQRLLPARSTRTAAPTTRRTTAGWAAGDLARPRRGLLGLPELPHPAGRGRRQQHRRTSAPPRTPRSSLGAKFVSNSYGVLGEDPSETGFDQYYNHPGVAVIASTGDTGNVRQLARRQPDVTGGRRHHADPGHLGRRAAGTRPRGTAAAPAARRSSRSRATRPTSTPAAPTARRSPTSSADADPNTGAGRLRHQRQGRLAAGRRHQPVLAAPRRDVRAGAAPRPAAPTR